MMVALILMAVHKEEAHKDWLMSYVKIMPPASLSCTHHSLLNWSVHLVMQFCCFSTFVNNGPLFQVMGDGVWIIWRLAIVGFENSCVYLDLSIFGFETTHFLKEKKKEDIHMTLFHLGSDILRNHYHPFISWKNKGKSGTQVLLGMFLRQN